MMDASKRVTGRKIRLGVVGCGKISANHFAALEGLRDQFELVSVCDSHPESLNQICSKLTVVGYPGLERMLQAEPDLDLVTLCSPSGLHAEQTIQAAGYGRHVVTEKPMATRWSDGVEMVRACDRAGVQLFVVKQNRYQPSLQLLKEAITQGRFGRIYLVTLNVFWTRPQQYYDQAKWRGTWEFDGGAFMNQASHYVDLLDWLIGPVQSVQAMMATLARNMEVEDTGIVNIRWRSGTLGSMNFTMLTYPKNLEASLTILGEKGSVRVGGLSANRIDHWLFSDEHPMDARAKELTKPSEPDLPGSGHKIYYQNIAKTLRGEETADIDGRAGLRSLEIMVASYLSARDSGTVNLPLVF